MTHIHIQIPTARSRSVSQSHEEETKILEVIDDSTFRGRECDVPLEPVSRQHTDGITPFEMPGYRAAEILRKAGYTPPNCSEERAIEELINSLPRKKHVIRPSPRAEVKTKSFSINWWPLIGIASVALISGPWIVGVVQIAMWVWGGK